MKRKILVVVDMQNDFITGSLGNEDCRNAVKGCVELCRNGGFDDIIFTRDTHRENYLDTLEGQKLPVKHCIKGSKGWKIIDELWKFAKSNHEARSYIVDKDTFGSVENGAGSLPETIGDIVYNRYDNNYDDLEVHFCGVCTSICVLANMVIIRAEWPDLKIVLHTKATGDVTEEMKQAAFICAKAQQCELED